jgi:hypothetical protein
MSTPDPTVAPAFTAAPASTLTSEQAFNLLVEQQEVLRQREAQLLALQQQQDQTKNEVIKAELDQNDLFTKRARPMVVYAGLVFIFLNYVLFPAIALLHSGKQIKPLALPEDFWWAWGGIVATWSIGRSFEKTGASNRVTRLITGSKVSAAASVLGSNDGAVG